MPPDGKDAVVVIPARYGSSRFPGKPMHPVAGRSMLERVWRIATGVAAKPQVLIATEDQRIVEFAASFGADAVMTSPGCENGTERVQDAVETRGLRHPIVINLQGDAILTPPWVIDAMIDAMRADDASDLVTPAVELDPGALEAFRLHKAGNPTSGTTVVFDSNHRALYFSKQVLPFQRAARPVPVYRHVGLYAFRRESLARFVSLAPTPLSETEGLEQLKALEHGMTVKVVIVDYRGRTHGSVDAPGDVAVVEEIIGREGELVGA